MKIDTPAAPAAEAPAQPAAPETPAAVETPAQQPEQPQKSPFQEKMERLRADLAARQAGEEGAPAQPAEQSTAEGAEATPEPEGQAAADLALPDGWSRTETGKVKRPDGTFASQAQVDAIAAGQDPATTQPAKAEGTDLFVAKLPGRRPDDGDFELAIPRAALEQAGIDPDEALQRINQLRNDGLRRTQLEEAMRPVQDQQAELDAIYEAMESDPSGFLSARVAPKLREQVAADILLALDDDAFARVLARADGWYRDPATRRVERTEAENQRLRSDKDRRDQLTERGQHRSFARDVSTNITALIPDDMDDARADRFYRAAVLEIQNHVVKNKLTALDARDVPRILADVGLLGDYGLSPDGKPATPAERAAANGNRPTRPDPKAHARPTGEDARKRMERRKSAAATAPAGAGSAATAGFQKVPGETYQQRRDRLAQKLGLGRK